MGGISPCGVNLIEEAVRRFGPGKGARVLDVGCGEGDTLAHLAEIYAFKCTGIDQSDEMVRRGRAKHPDLDLRKGEADFLDGFASNHFDAIIMECVLSLNTMPEEALHEAWCVMKPEGRLFISDLCGRDTARSLAAGDMPAASNRIRSAQGYIDIGGLIAACAELDMNVLCFEDHTTDLDAFAAEKIMTYGSLDAYFTRITPKGESVTSYCGAFTGRPPGYFLAVFEKRGDLKCPQAPRQNETRGTHD
jgi:SAM-dependent methyltransferase